MLEADLPNGVTRDPHCSPYVGLENCHALQFEFANEDGSESSCIVWRDDRVDFATGDLIRSISRSKKLSQVGSNQHIVG